MANRLKGVRVALAFMLFAFDACLVVPGAPDSAFSGAPLLLIRAGAPGLPVTV
jgi:hypothetical protein